MIKYFLLFLCVFLSATSFAVDSVLGTTAQTIDWGTDANHVAKFSSGSVTSTPTWEQVVGLPQARSWFACISISNKIYVVGGWYINAAQTTTFEFDGNSWTSRTDLANLLTGVYNTAGAARGSELHVIGGRLSNNSAVNYNQLWDLIGESPAGYWGVDTAYPLASYGYTACTFNSAIFGIGGSGYITNVYSSVAEVAWVPEAGLPSGRAYLGSAVLGNYLYAIGGANSSVVATTNVFRFDGTNWSEVAGLPAARLYLSCATLGNRIYAVGGYEGTTAKTNVYKFDGDVWTEVIGLPSVRQRGGVGVIGTNLYYIGGTATTSTQVTNVFKYHE